MSDASCHFKENTNSSYYQFELSSKKNKNLENLYLLPEA